MYSEAARKTAKIEGEQHRLHLEQDGVLGLHRPVRITAAAATSSAELEANQKIVHWVRHGQAFHNLFADVWRECGKTLDSTGTQSQASNPYQRSEMLDPPLTALGRQQAKALQEHWPALKNVEAAFVSPMRRAVETALLGFGEMPNVLKFIGQPRRRFFLAHQDATECSGHHICDKRRPLAEVRADFPSLDWRQIKDEEDPLWTDERESSLALSNRTYSFLLWLRERTEKEVVVVSHSAWLFSLLNTSVECLDPVLAEWFLTGELRSVISTFTDRDDPVCENDCKRQRVE
jgi:broad specificity phosphatase PhoE